MSYRGFSVEVSQKRRATNGRPSYSEVVELAIALDKAEFTEMYIRFLLTKTTPDRISDWRDLVVELGHDFDLKLMNPEDNTLIPCIDFPTILAQDENFINLSEYFG